MSSIRDQLIKQVNGLLEQVDAKTIGNKKNELSQQSTDMTIELGALTTKLSNIQKPNIQPLRNELFKNLQGKAKLTTEKNRLTEEYNTEEKKLGELQITANSTPNSANKAAYAESGRSLARHKLEIDTLDKQLEVFTQDIQNLNKRIKDLTQESASNEIEFKTTQAKIEETTTAKNRIDAEMKVQEDMLNAAVTIYNTLSPTLIQIKTALEGFNYPKNNADNEAFAQNQAVLNDIAMIVVKGKKDLATINKLNEQANNLLPAILSTIALRTKVNDIATLIDALNESKNTEFNDAIDAWASTQKKYNGPSKQAFFTYLRDKTVTAVSLEEILEDINAIVTTESEEKAKLVECTKNLYAFGAIVRENDRKSGKTAPAATVSMAAPITKPNPASTASNPSLPSKKPKVKKKNLLVQDNGNINSTSTATVANTNPFSELSSGEESKDDKTRLPNRTVTRPTETSSFSSQATSNDANSTKAHHLPSGTDIQLTVTKPKSGPVTIQDINREEMKALLESHTACATLLTLVNDNKAIEGERVTKKLIELSKNIQILKTERDELHSQIEAQEKEKNAIFSDKDRSDNLHSNFDDHLIVTAQSKAPDLANKKAEIKTAEENQAFLPIGIQVLQNIPATLAPDEAQRPADSADVMIRAAYFNRLAKNPEQFRKLAAEYVTLQNLLTTYKSNLPYGFFITLPPLVLRLKTAALIDESIGRVNEITNEIELELLAANDEKNDLSEARTNKSPSNTALASFYDMPNTGSRHPSLSRSSSFSLSNANDEKSTNRKQPDNAVIIDIDAIDAPTANPAKPKSFWQRHKWKIVAGIGLIIGGGIAAVLSFVLQSDLISPYVTWLNNLFSSSIAADVAFVATGCVAGAATVLTVGAAGKGLSKCCCRKKPDAYQPLPAPKVPVGGSSALVDRITSATGEFVVINVAVTSDSPRHSSSQPTTGQQQPKTKAANNIPRKDSSSDEEKEGQSLLGNNPIPVGRSPFRRK